MKRLAVVPLGALVAAASALLVGCPEPAPGSGGAADFTLTLVNQSGRTLRHYPVVTTPGQPPSRQYDPAGDVPDGGTGTLDPAGFNPAYSSIFFGLPQPNGLYVQLDLDSDPATVLVKVMHFNVPPGEEGTDPADQPTLEDQVYAELTTPGAWEIVVPQDYQVTIQPSAP